jgi:hypothetical protein
VISTRTRTATLMTGSTAGVLLWLSNPTLAALTLGVAVTGLTTRWVVRAKPWVVWQTRRNCFHHDRRTGTSWVDERLIETGMRKMFYCRTCRKIWFT